MNQSPYIAKESSSQGDDNRISIIPILVVLTRYKRLFLLLPLVVMVITAGISLIMTNVYEANTKLLPPQQSQSGASALLSQLGGMASLAGGLSTGKGQTDVYIGMLRSRTVADQLIKRFDLKKNYATESSEKAREKIEKATQITAGKDGLITISVEDPDQKLVARLANGYVEELIKLSQVLAVTEAQQRRMFFERELETAKNNLAKAEVTLRGALNTRGVISVDVASKSQLETIARVRAEISARQIKLDSMKAFVTETNPEYKRVAEELNSLKSELFKLENGRPDQAGTNQGGTAAQTGLENIQTLRDVKYYETLYEVLAKQYEAARLDEAKDGNTIQVLDPAIEPERRAKPKRAIMVLLSGVAAIFAAIFIAFFLEVKARVVRDPEWQLRKSGANSRN